MVKAYLLRQCEKLLSGRVSVADLVFASEVRLGTYASDGNAPPAAQVAMQRQRLDPADQAEMGERVPFVVVHSPNDPMAKLRESARRPEALLFQACQSVSSHL